VGLFTWLLGKNKESMPALASEKRDGARSVNDPPLAASALEPKKSLAPESKKVLSPADNLKHWRESGQARTWVQARKGQWNHGDWLSLLEELKRSPYWPMEPAAVGQVLEETKREWLQRN
jgi:hypothetical protein